jgi:ribosomal protein L12E/L44/L45/RPP1/RPP2
VALSFRHPFERAIEENQKKMKHIAAYLLLQIGGNASPSADDITNLLATVGIDPDTERLEKLISELDGKSINDLIVEGSSKLSSVRPESPNFFFAAPK